MIPKNEKISGKDLPENSVSLTFAGHATWLIEGPGGRVITDPMLAPRIAGIYPRVKPPGFRAEEVPPLDAVMVSHPHLDHMDAPTLEKLDKRATLCVPRGVGTYASRFGYARTEGMDSWESIEPAPGLKITAVPTRHMAFRGLGRGAAVHGATGFIIEIGGVSIYFPGDTAYGEHFEEIGRRMKPLVALMPIGAYRPRFIMGNFHMDPTRALQAFVDTGAKWLAPYHYGTFILSLEPLREPLRLLKKAAIRRNLMDNLAIIPRGGMAILNGTGELRISKRQG